VRIRLTVNGVDHESDVEPRSLLVHHLRHQLGLTGTNVGCDTSSCGACTVIVDGQSVKSCTMLTVQANGREVTTIEGLADGDEMHPMQQAFQAEHGLQCGYCTPGMIMGTVGLLNETPNPSDGDILSRMQRHLCRCCNYPKVLKAIRRAAGQIAKPAASR
jgi:carbon-monoxide dehydrogenase small subunit